MCLIGFMRFVVKNMLATYKYFLNLQIQLTFTIPHLFKKLAKCSVSRKILFCRYVVFCVTGVYLGWNLDGCVSL